MDTHDEKCFMGGAWLIVIGFTIFRFFYAGVFPLVPDEANYWQWGRHLAWGYHDQAPMIGWTIGLFTRVFGHHEMVVRLPSVLAVGVASAYLVAIAKRWLGSAVAFNTALLSQAILFFNVGGLLATADGLQAAGWAAASYHVARGYEDNSWEQWLLGGFWFGFGILSKYTMVIFLPGVYLFGLLSVQHRSRLAGIRPYVGVLLGIVMFLPVVYWNAVNDWSSVRHVAYLGGANEGFAIHGKYLGEYLASEAALLSPLVFLLIVMAWYYVLRGPAKGRNWIYSYLLWTSLPMVAGFALLSLHSRVYGNWPGSGYLTAVVLVAAFFTGHSSVLPGSGGKQRGQKIWPWAVGSAYLLSAIVLVQVVWPILPLSNDLDRAARETVGWRQLGVQADKLLRGMPQPQKTFMFGLRYQIASELAFYAPGQPETVSINRWKRPNVYDYWWQDEDLLGWDAVGVSYNARDIAPLREIFERVDEPVRLEVYRDFVLWPQSREQPVQVFYLYRAYGFKGGLRWLPADPDDIRAT